MIKKLLSYIWPQTVKIDSDYNGVLELTVFKGKKMLDSKNANYSYGTLQEILEIGISKINLKKAENVLLLGLGGGSAVKSLREKFDYQKEIIAVELDAKIINIAKEEFLIKETEKLKIVHQNALQYIVESNQFFDLIIVDIFVDQKVPEIFYTSDFCEPLYRNLTDKGTILFNLGMNKALEEGKNNVEEYFINKGCIVNQYKKVLKTNTLLIAYKK